MLAVVSILFSVGLTGPLTVQALSVENVGQSIGLGTADLKDVLIHLIGWGTGLLGILTVMMVIIGGFQWLLSGGDEDRVAGAKRTISAAIIGLIIILLAWAVVNYVIHTTANVTGAG